MSMSVGMTDNGIGFVKQLPCGRICQIGLTESQHYILSTLLASFSQDGALPLLPEGYDLVLKSEVQHD